jgi:hypothetical protein
MLLSAKSLIADYQQVTNSLIFAIFVTKVNVVFVEAKIRVKKMAFSEHFFKI